MAGGALDQVDPNDGRVHQLLKPMPRPARQLGRIEAHETDALGVIADRVGVQDRDPLLFTSGVLLTTKAVASTAMTPKMAGAMKDSVRIVPPTRTYG
jgi:hypothetical protein